MPVCRKPQRKMAFPSFCLLSLEQRFSWAESNPECCGKRVLKDLVWLLLLWDSEESLEGDRNDTELITIRYKKEREGKMEEGKKGGREGAAILSWTPRRGNLRRNGVNIIEMSHRRSTQKRPLELPKWSLLTNGKRAQFTLWSRLLTQLRKDGPLASKI